MKSFTFRFLLCGLILTATFAAASERPAETPDALIKHGHFKQARTLLQEQLKQNPSDPEKLVLLARVHLAYEEFDPAIKLLRQAIELQPGKAEAHVSLGEAYGQKVQRAGIFDRMGLAKNVRKESEVAVAADPKNLDALESLMEFHLQAPGIVGGDKDKGRELARKINSIDPVRGSFAMAEVAARDKRFDQQKEYQLKAVAIAPHSYDALTAAASLLLNDRWHDYSSAEKYSRQAIEIDPTRVRAYTLLAESYAATGKLEALDKLLARAEQQVPDDLSPYFASAQTLLANNREADRAEKYLRTYLGREPEGEAPSLATAHWQLGLALEQQGRKDDAIDEIKLAVQMKPGLTGAHRDLERLKS